MSPLQFAATGSLAMLDAAARHALFDRNTTTDDTVRERTRDVIARVRRESDAALLAFAREFDGATLESLEVPRAAWDAALDSLEPTLRHTLERAAANIRRVHEAFRPVAQEVTTADGAVIGRRPDPLTRVGVYALGDAPPIRARC